MYLFILLLAYKLLTKNSSNKKQLHVLLGEEGEEDND